MGSDLRLIVHRTDSSLLLCYVDHHDKAYQWAERRKLETHPKTGAAQFVEIRQTVREVTVPVYTQIELPSPPPSPKRALFAHLTDDQLLAYGVPPEWLADVRTASEETLLGLADHFPAEASEALLELATGGKPRVPQPVGPEVSPFDHPDAQRRFRVMGNIEELRQALEFPWDKWTVFLHPEQRQWVERDYAGPARVSGSAGTGKTIVALHRAVYLARKHPDIRVLKTEEEETSAIAAWITDQTKAGVLPHEFGVFVRTQDQFPRAHAAIDRAGLTSKTLDDHVETASGKVSIGTMHPAKGLEFRAVVVLACDDEIVPLQSRIETVGDEADLKDIYDTERHLLYVACTRARDHLLVTGVTPASEFLDDLAPRG